MNSDIGQRREKKMKLKLGKILRVSIALMLVIHIYMLTCGSAYGASLTLTLATSKEEYNLGEKVVINGTLTSDGTPISDGLATIQIDKPDNISWVLRTRPTGTNTTGSWSLEVTAAAPIGGGGGEPKYIFYRGDEIGFQVTVKNNEMISHEAELYVNLFYASEPLSLWPVLEIPGDAELGDATAYLSLLTDLPVNGGFAYCPEKSTTFTITTKSTSSSQSSSSQTIQNNPAEGEFTLTARIPDQDAKLGNYTVYATSFYRPNLARSTLTFKVILLGDITGPTPWVPDGKVDIRDVAAVAIRYGCDEGMICYDVRADLTGPTYGVPDGKIDIRDVAFVAKNYGKEGIP